MLRIAIKFFVIFIPTSAAALGGIWVARNQTGFWSAVGWGLAAVFGVAALLQILILINGLVQVIRFRDGAGARLEELEQRDAEMFAQGKSFDEIISQYKRPRQ